MRQNVCVGLIILGVLVSLFAPTGLITQFAGVIVMASIAALIYFTGVELIFTLRSTRSSQLEDRTHRLNCVSHDRRNCPEDCSCPDRCRDVTEWVDVFVDGTAMDLINWDD